jgi:hypothetical protein
MNAVKLMLAVTMLFGMLPVTAVSAAVDQKDPINKFNDNVIYLTRELANDVGKSLEATLASNGSYRVYPDESKEFVVYTYSNDKLDITNEVHNVVEKKEANSPDAVLASYCGYYYDYAWWMGRELAVCGYSGQVMRIPRLSARWWGNDDITSVLHTHSQIYTELFEHDNYAGWRYGTGWDRYLLPAPYNNRASSMKVWFP